MGGPRRGSTRGSWKTHKNQRVSTRRGRIHPDLRRAARAPGPTRPAPRRSPATHRTSSGLLRPPATGPPHPAASGPPLPRRAAGGTRTGHPPQARARPVLAPRPAQAAGRRAQVPLPAPGAGRRVQVVGRPVLGADRPAQVVGRPVRRADRPAQVVGRPVRRADRPAQVVGRPVRRADRPAQVVGRPVRATGRWEPEAGPRAQVAGREEEDMAVGLPAQVAQWVLGPPPGGDPYGPPVLVRPVRGGPFRMPSRLCCW
jgi:hypothetical protein